MTKMNTATRLFTAAVLVIIVACGSYWVQASLQMPNVELPQRDFHTMPVTFGPWHGQRVNDLTPELFNAIGADVVVDSAFEDNAGHNIALHTAIFRQPDTGVYHSPMNCYRAAGWQEADDTLLSMEIKGQPSRPVRFTTWTREGQRVRVLYWFQLGEHTLFSRFDLGKLRWEMGGTKTWPALIKVLMNIKATNDVEQDQQRLLSLAKPVYKWISDDSAVGPAASTPTTAPATVAAPPADGK